MAAAELRFLVVFSLELGADAVEKLNIALLRVLLESVDEGPRHGARGLAGNGCVGPVSS